MTPNLHLWLIPVLPLIGAAINGLFRRRFSRQTVAAVALAFCGAAFVLALWAAALFSSLPVPHLESVATWIRAGSFQVGWSVPANPCESRRERPLVGTAHPTRLS